MVVETCWPSSVRALHGDVPSREVIAEASAKGVGRLRGHLAVACGPETEVDGTLNAVQRPRQPGPHVIYAPVVGIDGIGGRY